MDFLYALGNLGYVCCPWLFPNEHMINVSLSTPCTETIDFKVIVAFRKNN